jgi:hypothetical protein
MSVAVYIQHAVWVRERGPTLERLLADLDGRAVVLRSAVPEHSSVWARRAWDRALEDGTTHPVFLNDDVRVCPGFIKACDAIAEARPHDVISLHTTAPEAKEAGAWLRSYWLTGPAYMVPRDALKSLCTFADEWAHYFQARVNEDNIAIIWAWSRQAPMWLAVPALAEHDVSTKSTLGHDRHALRVPSVTWRDRPDARVTRTDYWRAKDAPIIECAWFPSKQIQDVYQRRGQDPICAFCSEARGEIRSTTTGEGICRHCLIRCLAGVLGVHIR